MSGASLARSAGAPSEMRSSLKSLPMGTMTVAATPARAQRRARRSAASAPSSIVVAGDDQARDAGRRREGAEAAGGERRCGADLRHGGNEREHRLDALADDERSESVGGDGAEPDTACPKIRPSALLRCQRRPPWRAGADRARCAARRAPRRHCRSRRRPAPGSGARTSLRDSEAPDGSAAPRSGSARAREHADSARHGYRRWRGIAATGGAPLRSRRSRCRGPWPAQPPDRGPGQAPARKARASSSAARSDGARMRWRMRSSRSPCCPLAASVLC